MARNKGLPTIRQRKDKNGKKLDIWEAQVNLGKHPGTGKTKREAVYGKTQKECRDKLLDKLSSIKNQTYVEPNKVTLSQWLDTWMDEYKRGSIRPTTYSSYEYIIRVHLKKGLGAALLKDLKPEQVQAFYNSKKESGLSSRTVRYIHVVLHEALEQAIMNNLIVRNVTDATKLPKQDDKEMRVLTQDEQKKFMDTLTNERLKALFILDLAAGLRRGELLGLRWCDVDLKEGFIDIKQTLSRIKTNFDEESTEKKTEIIIQKPKTKKGERGIPLLANIVTMLKEHKKRQVDDLKLLGWNEVKIKEQTTKGLVFISELGGHIEPRNLTRKFYKLIKASGIDKANFHSLRHTFATRGVESGIDIKVMQDLLGHEDISTTSRYTHSLMEAKRISIDKMSGLFGNIEEKKKIAVSGSKRK